MYFFNETGYCVINLTKIANQIRVSYPFTMLSSHNDTGTINNTLSTLVSREKFKEKRSMSDLLASQ